jgi:P27 family predicted phage terminase small subunit
MTSGRKPTPTALKLVKGNPGKRALNKREPRVKLSQPSAPSFLNDDAKAEWSRVAGTLFDVGLMTELDRAALAAYCQAYGRWAEAERALARMAAKDEANRALMVKTVGGNAIQNPLVGIANKAKADMVKYAIEFGMTPSARSKVIAGDPDAKDDPAQEFFG